MQEFYNHLSTVTRAHPNKRVFFTGHSLGAAVAQLCAVEFSVLAGHTPYVYSFGSPRVGDDEWRNFARQRIWHFRFKNDHDLVPEVPIWGRVRDGIVSRIIAIRKLYRHAADAAIRLMPQTGQYLCFNEFAAVGRDSIDDHSLTNYIAKIGGI
jgi:alpha-beta hydrolase superfamily lysophospholipase